MTRRMKTAIISDIHVLQQNRDEAFARLDDTVERIREEDPDLVIVLGDMIGGAVTTGKEAPEEEEGISELKEVREKIEEIDAETLYLLGNHEQDIEKGEFAEVFGQETFGVKEVRDENFIYLDSSALELSGSRGQISREQLEFLDEKLQELEDAFLVIHHPVHFRDLSHSCYWDIYPERAFCGNKKEINNVLEKHGNVKMVLNSHIHDLNLTEFKGRLHYTNPPFISESREEGFYEYFTVLETGENISLKTYRGKELEKTFNI
jgi:3',5'-cyclic AMP phosphodiesterase CpdA